MLVVRRRHRHRHRRPLIVRRPIRTPVREDGVGGGVEAYYGWWWWCLGRKTVAIDDSNNRVRRQKPILRNQLDDPTPDQN